QLDQLIGVLRRERVGNGGEQLRHLHDRTFQPAQRGGELECVRRTVKRHAEKPSAGKTRGGAAQLRADLGVAPGAGREAIFFAVFHGANAAIPFVRSTYIVCSADVAIDLNWRTTNQDWR